MASSAPMKALILVGGFGTRLRPFTFTLPKPLVPFVNKAIVLYQIEALMKVGVKEIVLAVNVQPKAMVDFLSKFAAEHDLKIHYSQEDEPLGTAGPLALAREHLCKDDAPFFMFNSDVICDFPLEAIAKFHQSHGGEGTVMVTEVKDPSKYGVILADQKTGQIQQFIEKPQVFVSNKINAGIYLLNPSIIKRIAFPPVPTSIEREIFPKVAADGLLYSMVLPGYWMDIGQPKDFLSGTVLHLDYLKKTAPDQLTTGAEFKGSVLVDKTAKIGKNCVIGPDVVIGANVTIGDGVRIQRSTLMEGVSVKNCALVKDSIIGWNSSVGEWARVEGCSLGEDVAISKEVAVFETIVLPHKGIGNNMLSAGTIVM